MVNDRPDSKGANRIKNRKKMFGANAFGEAFLPVFTAGLRTAVTRQSHESGHLSSFYTEHHTMALTQEVHGGAQESGV